MSRLDEVFEVGMVRTDRGLFLDKGTTVFDLRHPDIAEQVDPLAYAVNLIGSDVATILLAGGETWTMLGDLTLPSNVTLYPLGGYIDRNGHTLTIEGPVLPHGYAYVIGSGTTVDSLVPVRMSFGDAGGAVYNVKAYGALGDGSTSDTVAVQEAIDAANAAGGGVVWVPAGDYPVAIEITDNVVVECAPGVVLRAAGASSPVRITGENTGLSGCRISGQTKANEDLGNNTVTSSHALQITGTGVTVEDVTSGRCRFDSLYLSGGAAHVRVRRCTLEPTARNTVSIVEAHDVTFEDCSFTQTSIYSNGTDTGLYLLDIEPISPAEVYRVAFHRCEFTNNLSQEASGVILLAEARGAQPSNAVSFEDCEFFTGTSVSTTLRINGTGPYVGLHLSRCVFEARVLYGSSSITLTESSLIGNRHGSSSFAFQVSLDDVLLAGHKGAGWTGLTTSTKTQVVGCDGVTTSIVQGPSQTLSATTGNATVSSTSGNVLLTGATQLTTASERRLVATGGTARYREYLKAISITDAVSFTSILTIGTRATYRITIAGGDASNGSVGLGLVVAAASCSNDAIDQASLSEVINHATGGIDVQWETASDGTWSTSRATLQVRPRDTAANMWVVRVEVWSNDATSSNVTWLV